MLLPLEVMIKPLELRFKYHFDGDRPTNKLNKVFRVILCLRLSELTDLARIFSFTHRWIAQYVRGFLRSVLAAHPAQTVSAVKSCSDLYIH